LGLQIDIWMLSMEGCLGRGPWSSCWRGAAWWSRSREGSVGGFVGDMRKLKAQVKV